MNVMVNNSTQILQKALTPLGAFLADASVVEISVNKPGHVYVERLGMEEMEFHHIPTLTTAEITHLGQMIAAQTEQFVNRENPILSAALPTGERVQVVLPPAAADGGTISIRKQVINEFSLEDYRERGALDKIRVHGVNDVEIELRKLLREERFYEFIKTAIERRVSILISGGTSSGKTTFLNACLRSVGAGERIITLEDTRELRPPQKNVVHLVASRGGQGASNVTIQSLLESSLRMRPDRLFVGEVRGAEAFSFLQAINTGHPGSMGTVHADTPLGAYERLAMMMQQSGFTAGYSKADLMSYIRMVIPIVIQLRREGGKRGISEIYLAEGGQ